AKAGQIRFPTEFIGTQFFPRRLMITPKLKGFPRELSYNLEAALATHFHNKAATTSNRDGSLSDGKTLVWAIRATIFGPLKTNLWDANLILLKLIGLLYNKEGICGNNEGSMKVGFEILEEDPLAAAVQSFKNNVGDSLAFAGTKRTIISSPGD
ncbi:hypothetical protein A2U01_0041101, partial [Trifolium medium]|nr:hypothetical protein [Trifolium medium]